MGFKLNLVGFTFLKAVFSSYILYPANVTFTQAVQKCNLINATVVFPKNKTKDDFIRNNYLNNTSVSTGIWLAIYDYIGNDINVNYYTNQTLTYTNWFTGEPSTPTDYCVRYDKNFQKWADYPCNGYFSVLCELKKYASSSNTYTTNLISTSDTNKMNIPFWNQWNPWSFCQLFRHRNNSNISNGTECQILNVSCSQICKYSNLN
jgi:hypothetical protein